MDDLQRTYLGGAGDELSGIFEYLIRCGGRSYRVAARYARVSPDQPAQYVALVRDLASAKPEAVEIPAYIDGDHPAFRSEEEALAHVEEMIRQGAVPR